MSLDNTITQLGQSIINLADRRNTAGARIYDSGNVRQNVPIC